MKPIDKVTGRAIPFGRSNIDTDIIIPSKWLKTITRDGLKKGAFETVRAEPDNVFDNPEYQGAPILIAGDNFGCGSSREHAAWALLDMGISIVVAPSFSDIFSSNAFKNGIVTIELPQEQIDELLSLATSQLFHIDLSEQTLSAGNRQFSFEIDPFRKNCLQNGLDEVALTLGHDAAIAQFEKQRDANMEWIAPAIWL